MMRNFTRQSGPRPTRLAAAPADLAEALADLAVFGVVGCSRPEPSPPMPAAGTGLRIVFDTAEPDAPALSVSARHCSAATGLPFVHQPVLSLMLDRRTQPEGVLFVPVARPGRTERFLAALRPGLRRQVADRIVLSAERRRRQVGGDPAAVFDAFIAPRVRQSLAAVLGWEATRIFPYDPAETLRATIADAAAERRDVALFGCGWDEPTCNNLFALAVHVLYFTRAAPEVRRGFRITPGAIRRLARDATRAQPGHEVRRGEDRDGEDGPMSLAEAGAMLAALQLNFLAAGGAPKGAARRSKARRQDANG